MPSPIMKATLASAALSSASNVLSQILAQYGDDEPFAFDMAQLLRFITVTLLTAPPNYMWQQMLERTFPAYGTHHSRTHHTHNYNNNNNNHQLSEKKNDDKPRDLEKQLPQDNTVSSARDEPAVPKPILNIQNTLTKWFIDCITLGAIFNTVAFLVLMGILKGQPAAMILHNVRTQTIHLIVEGYKIWPFASIFSFSCVPVEKRIVFLNFVGLLWGIYLSLVAAEL